MSVGGVVPIENFRSTGRFRGHQEATEDEMIEESIIEEDIVSQKQTP